MSDSEEYKYNPGFLPTKAMDHNAWALYFLDKKLLMGRKENTYYIPTVNEVQSIRTEEMKMYYIGSYEGHDCYCMKQKESLILPEYLEPVELREITNLSNDAGLFILAGAANHLLHWYEVNRYCGYCGHEMTDKTDERAKNCPKCGHFVYPRISPATITAVFRDDEILLAHNSNFREGLYSLIAGYVEPGETLEQCVEREIREEVGLKVKNIHYFGSQPWPFPDSLMMAFTAEYDSGEINVDHIEISDAAWFKADTLPGIPSTDSIAGKLIRWYKDGKTK